MATGSRGAGRDVDNDNVTPNQPALKNGAGHTHTHVDAEMEEQFSSFQVLL